MIGKLTRTIVRTFAFALALCATSGAWAAIKDCSQGQSWYVTTTATTAFEGVRLSDIGTNYRLCGKIKGGWMPTAQETYACARYDYTEETAIRYEMQYLDGTTLKCVVVKLTEESVNDGESYNVKIQAIDIGAKSNWTTYGTYFMDKTDSASDAASDWSGSTTPANISSDGADGVYGLYDLRLAPTAMLINCDFNGNLANAGSAGGNPLSYWQPDVLAFDSANKSVLTSSHVANGTTFTYPTEWTAVFRCNTPAPKSGRVAIITFGGNNGNVIGLAATANTANSVHVADHTGNVRISNTSVTDSQSSLHTYAIARTASSVQLWIDGVKQGEYEGTITPADGFQLGTVYYGGLTSHFLNLSANDTKPESRFDFLRIYEGAASDGFMKEIVADYPVEYIYNTATVSEDTDWSDITWSEGSWVEGMDVKVTVANTPTITFDSAVAPHSINFLSEAGGVTLAGTKPSGTISYSGVAGEVTCQWAWTGSVSSRAGGLKLTGGAGTAESSVAFTPAGGSITFDGSGNTPYYLSFGNSGTSTTINFNDAEVVTSSFDLGTATATVGGDSDITATRVILSQGANSRTASLTVKDSAKLTVTGTTNADQNTASIMFGHWNGASTFTLQDSAEFVSEEADVLVGKTGNNHTININGGVFNVKGVKLAANASGTNTLNLNGGELQLGATGITSYSNSRTMAVNVKEDSKITTTADSVPITQAVTVDADKTLTLDGGGTITFTSLTLNAGSSLVLVNGTKAVINGGTIDDAAIINVGTGTINITQLRPNAVFTFESGGRLEMTEVTSESGTTTLNVADDTMPAVTLYDASGNAIAGVIPSISGSTLTITATGGKACWMDYEFNGNGNSIGTDTTALSASSFYDGQAMYIYDTPWRDVNKNSGGWGDEWSAVTRFTNPEINKTVIVTFGSQSAYLGFVSGGKGSVKFVAHSSGGSKEELCTLDISDDPLAPHVYAIKKTATSIAVYLDGVQKYSNDSKAITINQGMQIGSMHGGVADGYYNAGANLLNVDGTPARMDFLRVYKGTISDSEISAIVSEFSGISTYTANVISASTLDFSDLEWYEGWTRKAGWPNDYKTKMIVAVADDVTLSLPETLRAYDITFVVSSGKTLTLQCAGNGSSLLTEAGVTIGYPQSVLSYDGTVKIVGSLRAGPISKGADGATLDTAEGSVLNALGSVDVNVTGDGTIVYNRFLPKSGSGTSWTDSSKWAGTVWIKNRTIEGIQLNNYGNAESTVKLTAVSGYLAECTSSKYYTITPAIEVEGSGLDIQNGWGADRLTIRELKGTGTFKSSGGGEGIFHIKKIDNFAGDWNTSKRLFYIGDDSFDVTTSSVISDRNGTTILKCNASIPSGKTWTIGANGYIKIEDGVILSVTGTLSAKVKGAGKINYNYLPTVNNPSSTTIPTLDGTWTGEVVLPDTTVSVKTGVPLVALGSVAGTKLVLKGIRRTNNASIHLNSGTTNINATVQLDGPVFITDGNSNAIYTWNKITGEGNLTVSKNGGTATKISHAITTLHDYLGTLATEDVDLTIGTVNVSELDLSVGDPIVRLANGANVTFPSSLNVADTATAHALFKAADGNLYVKVASVTVDATTTYYPTLRDAADAALAAGGETVTFTRVDSEAGTELTGWTYSEGVFTFNNEFAYNETKDVVYGTLQEAITASSDGDTIKLLADTDETAVDTTGKDFIFDENGYAFSGTWTGSGIITLPSAPVQTSWSSDMFVSTGDTVWTGKVVLGWDIASGVLPLCNYGIAGSTVEVAETFSGWFDTSAGDVTISPTIDISGSLTLNNGYSGKIVTFTKVKGSGILTFDCLYTHNITTLENWDGVLTYANTTAGSGSISRIESGSGKVSSVRSFTPTFGDDWQGAFEIQWTHSSGNLNINNYGTAKSSVTIGTAVTGGFVGTANAITTYAPKLVLDAELKLNNGYAYSSYQNALSSISVFEAVTGDGNMTFAFTSGYSGYWTAYQVNTFENYGGTITLPERNEIVIGKLKYPSSASASLVPDTKLISISANLNSKILNSSQGDVTTAGVPVYVENTDSGMKAVYKTDGLYIAVARVGTAYYATIHDAIAAAGGGSVTVTLLVDTDEDVALAHGQVLDTGTTTYTGTVSAADSSANLVHDGTTYSIRYGTIFSVY